MMRGGAIRAPTGTRALAPLARKERVHLVRSAMTSVESLSIDDDGERGVIRLARCCSHNAYGRAATL